MLRHLRKPRLGLVLIAPALIALLALLLWQQARWLRELSVAERARLAALLTATAERLATELASSAADAELDEQVLHEEPERVHTLIAALASTQLGEDALQRFAIRIRELATGTALYDSERASGSETSAETGAAEARAPLLWGKPHWAARFVAESGPSVEVGAPMLLSLASQAGNTGILAHATYVLELASRGESLDVLVARMHAQNLWLGGGTALVLVTSLALLWLGAQRARSSAERELAFVAGISHELRTPLAILRTAASNLSHAVVSEPERLREYGALLEREVLRLTGLVERALAFGTTEEAPLRRENCAIAELLEEALLRTRSLPGLSGLAVELDLPPPGTRSFLERDSLLMAVQNLLENAAKHGSSAAPVRLGARLLGEMLQIEVADRGPGLEAGEEVRIFEPFQRGSRAREMRSTGIGLGLSLVRRVALRHGGEAGVRRKDGWTIFSITLATPVEQGS